MSLLSTHASMYLYNVVVVFKLNSLKVEKQPKAGLFSRDQQRFDVQRLEPFFQRIYTLENLIK